MEPHGDVEQLADLVLVFRCGLADLDRVSDLAVGDGQDREVVDLEPYRG